MTLTDCAVNTYAASRHNAMTTHLIVKRQVTEARNVLCPLDQNEQLLLYRVAHVTHVGQFLLQHIRVTDRRRYLNITSEHASIMQWTCDFRWPVPDTWLTLGVNCQLLVSQLGQLSLPSLQGSENELTHVITWINMLFARITGWRPKTADQCWYGCMAAGQSPWARTWTAA